MSTSRPPSIPARPKTAADEHFAALKQHDSDVFVNVTGPTRTKELTEALSGKTVAFVGDLANVAMKGLKARPEELAGATIKAGMSLLGIFGASNNLAKFSQALSGAKAGQRQAAVDTTPAPGMEVVAPQ